MCGVGGATWREGGGRGLIGRHPVLKLVGGQKSEGGALCTVRSRAQTGQQELPATPVPTASGAPRPVRGAPGRFLELAHPEPASEPTEHPRRGGRRGAQGKAA